MAILNWFSKKQDRVRKEGDGVDEKKIKPVASPKSKDAQQSVKKQPPVSGHVAAHSVLRGAHITEKSTMGHQDGKYVFDIFAGVESPTVRQAVEAVYKVHVQNVQIIKVRPQKRHRGRFASMHKRPNKAIVTLRKGETIDIMS